MSRTSITVVHSDLTRKPVDDSEAVEIIVLSHPDLKRPVRLDAAASEVEGLKDLSQTLVRLSVNGEEIIVDGTKFSKLFGKGVDAEAALRGAERVTEPSAGGRAPRGKAKTNTADLGAIREWARANGYAVADRGRISQEVQDAYAGR